MLRESKAQLTSWRAVSH